MFAGEDDVARGQGQEGCAVVVVGKHIPAKRMKVVRGRVIAVHARSRSNPQTPVVVGVETEDPIVREAAVAQAVGIVHGELPDKAAGDAVDKRKAGAEGRNGEAVEAQLADEVNAYARELRHLVPRIREASAAP